MAIVSFSFLFVVSICLIHFLFADVSNFLSNRIPIPTVSYSLDNGVTNFAILQGNANALPPTPSYAGMGAQSLGTIVKSITYSFIQFNSFITGPSASVHLIFRITSSVFATRPLFLLSPLTLFNNVLTSSTASSSSSIQMNILGNQGNTNENDIQFRVFSKGNSCANNVPPNCVLDLPGIIQPNVWYDMFLTIDAAGSVFLYLNSTLTGWGVNSFRMSTLPTTPYFLSVWPQDGPYMPETLQLRLVETYNIALTPDNVQDVSMNMQASLSQEYTSYFKYNFASPNPSITSLSQNSGNMASDNVAAPLYSDFNDPVINQIPITPFSISASFHEKDCFLLNQQFSNATCYLFGNAIYVQDVLQTPNMNGILLPDPTSYVSILPLPSSYYPSIMGGPSTFHFVFKLDPSTIVFNHTVLFSCSGTASNGQEVNRISLEANNLTSFVFTVFQGSRSSASVSGDISYNPLNLFNFGDTQGWVNLQIVMNNDQSVLMYNYGTLIGLGTIPLLYPARRPFCYLGRDTQIPQVSKACPACPLPPSYGTRPKMAFNSFRYYPFVLSSDSISSYQLPNTTLSKPLSSDRWDPVVEDFSAPYFVDDHSASASILRKDAVWTANATSEIPFPTVWVANPNDLTLTASTISSPIVPTGNNDPLTITPIYQGAMLLVNGSYLNLGPTSFGGFLTLKLVFTLLYNLTIGSTLIDFGNRLSAPMDNLVLKVGSVNNVTADLLLFIHKNGFNCTLPVNGSDINLCSLRIRGALRLNHLTTLFITFDKSLTTVYLDGSIVVTTTTLWTPPLVQRPYSFIGYSHGSSRICNMLVYAVAIHPKPATQADIERISPSLATMQTYQFTRPDSYPFVNVSATGTETPVFPIFHAPSNMFNFNPFQLTINDPSDNTNADGSNLPTAGLYFPDITSIESNIAELERDLELALAQSTGFSNNAQSASMNFGTYVNLTLPSNSSNSNSSTLVEINPQALQQLAAMGDFAQNFLDAFNALPSVQDSIAGINQEISFLKTFLNSINYWVELEPIIWASACTIRVKFRIAHDVPSNSSLPIFDSGNGYQNDNVMISASGPRSAVVVTLTIFRGSLFEQFVSTALDSSVFWLDLVWSVDVSRVVKLFNWGQLVSVGRIWTPIPGPRAFAYLGRTIGPNPQYLINAAVSVIQYQPMLLSATDIASWYVYDKPPVFTSDIPGIWTILDYTSLVPLQFRTTNQNAHTIWQCAGYNAGCSFDELGMNYNGNGVIGPAHQNSERYDLIEACNSLTQGGVKDLMIKVAYVQRLTTTIVPDPSYLYTALLRNVAQLYYSADNFFTDVSYATPGSYIQTIYYYQPTLLLFAHKFNFDCMLRIFNFDARFRNSLGDDPNLYIIPLASLDDDAYNTVFLSLSDCEGCRLLLLPPLIGFQYSQPNSSSAVPPFSSRANSFTFSSLLNMTDYFRGDRPYLDALLNQTVSNFVLAANERIIKVKSKCNYRFQFITNLGRTLSIGDYPFISNLKSCLNTIEFQIPPSGSIPTVGIKSQPYPSFLMANPLKNTNDPLDIEEGPIGSSLHFMEGTLGGMFAWKWHWVQTPVSYHMFNVNFNYDASTSLVGSNPSQFVSLDMYNHSPVAQTNWMTHSLSLTREQSFTNTDTKETSWNWGVSFTIAFTFGSQAAGFQANPSVTTSYGQSTSSSKSFSYGSSISTTEDNTQMLMANVPPHSKVTANMIVYQGTVDIPYTADVIITYANGQTQHVVTQGIFSDVHATSIIVSYSDAMPLDSVQATSSNNGNAPTNPKFDFF